jgi:DNA repair exonuclease SbcCD ATPase subunit
VDEGWNETWASQYRGADDPLFAEALSFLDESTKQQAQRRREEEEQRDRELRQAKALARERRRLAVVLTLVAVGSLVAAFWMYRQAEVAREAQAVAESAQADASNSRAAAEKLAGELGQLNALLEQERKLATSATASAADRARLQQEIEQARAQVAGGQQELLKLREAEQAGRSEAGGLQQRVDSLQQQLAAAAAERDKLQAQVSTMQGQVTQGTTAAERAAALQGQLDQERKRSAAADAEIARLRAQLAAATAAGGGSASAGGTAPITAATAQDVTRAFTEGVRAYDLRNWKASAQNMQEVIRLQPAVKDLPREYRLSGVRFVPHAPHSYLAAALLQLKADCASVLAELKQAESEPVPDELRTALQAARKQCGAQ